jgi:hypothetical protein
MSPHKIVVKLFCVLRMHVYWWTKIRLERTILFVDVVRKSHGEEQVVVSFRHLVVRFVGIATSITSISKTKGGGAGAGGVLSHDSGCGCCRCLYRARFLNSLLVVGRGRFASWRFQRCHSQCFDWLRTCGNWNVDGFSPEL